MSYLYGRTYRKLIGLALGSLAMFAFATAKAHAAAALAKGLTSCSVNSKDPAERQIEITFDPCFVSSSGAPTTALNVQAFDLSVGYDMSKLDLTSVSFDAPFQATCSYNSTLQNISGAAPLFATKPGDVNLFEATFTLKAGYSLTTPLTFTFGAGNNGFLVGVNPNNPFQSTLYTANQIVSSSVTTSISPQATPLPPVLAMSGVGLVGLMGLTLRKRRTATVA